ncbi:hypothetical protein EF294_20140 [Gordonia oryzae]|uniref:Uncharacterized protein n=1 Tax=Gordonia oryzae TaxID=2487349 RepID=A0A3N4G674_9ACTN|nr:hypothetical protein [Gordonia oryzae]RPA56897.1 hypothetical protein EF294_20140 [Gordonia oryzae]
MVVPTRPARFAPDVDADAPPVGFYRSISADTISMRRQADVVLLDRQSANDRLRETTNWTGQPFVIGGRSTLVNPEFGIARGACRQCCPISWIAAQSIAQIADPAGHAT